MELFKWQFRGIYFLKVDIHWREYSSFHWSVIQRFSWFIDFPDWCSVATERCWRRFQLISEGSDRKSSRSLALGMKTFEYFTSLYRVFEWDGIKIRYSEWMSGQSYKSNGVSENSLSPPFQVLTINLDLYRFPWKVLFERLLHR